MIYCPYVLIKLFQQTDFEKEPGEREEEGWGRGRGIEQRIQTRRQRRAGNRDEHRDKYVEKCIDEEKKRSEDETFFSFLKRR